MLLGVEALACNPTNLNPTDLFRWSDWAWLLSVHKDLQENSHWLFWLCSRVNQNQPMGPGGKRFNGTCSFVPTTLQDVHLQKHPYSSSQLRKVRAQHACQILSVGIQLHGCLSVFASILQWARNLKTAFLRLPCWLLPRCGPSAGSSGGKKEAWNRSVSLGLALDTAAVAYDGGVQQHRCNHSSDNSSRNHSGLEYGSSSGSRVLISGVIPILILFYFSSSANTFVTDSRHVNPFYSMQSGFCFPVLILTETKCKLADVNRSC